MVMPPLLAESRRRGLLRVFAAVCAQACAAAIAAFATRALFSALHQGVPLPLWAAFSLAGSGFCIAIARVEGRVTGEGLGQSYALAIRRALFDHGSRLSPSTVAARRQGYVALRFVGDMTAFRNWAGLGLPRLLAAIVAIPATLLVLAALKPAFFLAVAPIYGIALLCIGFGGLGLPQKQRTLRARRAALAADMAERMPLAPQLAALGRRSTEKRRVSRRGERLIEAAKARTRWSEALKAVCDVAAGTAALALIVWGALSGVSTASIAAGLAALGLAIGPMRDLAGVWTHWSAFRVAHAKAAMLLQRPIRQVATSGKTLPAGALSVSIAELCSGPLNQVSTEIAAGARLRLTGPNGAGKSRLLALLAGLEWAESGTLSLSGVEINQLSRGSLRRSVALITRDPVILKGSLRRALTLGLDQRPEDKIVLDTVDTCNLTRLLERCSGLDGAVPEGGRLLSAGERIKIALVRAMLGNPGLLLLDDIATALDGPGRDALEKLCARPDLTVITADTGAFSFSANDPQLELR